MGLTTTEGQGKYALPLPAREDSTKKNAELSCKDEGGGAAGGEGLGRSSSTGDADTATGERVKASYDTKIEWGKRTCAGRGDTRVTADWLTNTTWMTHELRAAQHERAASPRAGR